MEKSEKFGIQTVKSTVLTLSETSRFELTKHFIQHGNISVYSHCISVAVTSIRIANFFGIKVDRRALVRGALLHDYFLYDWHNEDGGTHKWHGFTHPMTALENARQDFKLSKIESDIIVHHMFPLVPIPPRSREAWIVCLSDKLCAIRETIFKR